MQGWVPPMPLGMIPPPPGMGLPPPPPGVIPTSVPPPMGFRAVHYPSQDPTRMGSTTGAPTTEEGDSLPRDSRASTPPPGDADYENSGD